MSNEAWLNAEIAFAQYLIRAGRLDAARDALFALEAPSAPIAVAAFNELGAALFAALRHLDAERAFRQALKLDPDDREAALGLGYALFNQGRMEDALVCFHDLSAHADAGAAPWRGIAAARINMLQFKEAEDALSKALERDPSDGESLALLGLSAYRAAKAERLWRDWTRQNLSDPKARPDLLAGALDARQLERALQALDQARRIDPRIRTEELAARLLTVSGKPEAALEFLAATPEPDGRSWQWMADVSWLLRDEAAARAYLRKSIEARAAAKPDPRPLGQELEAIPEVAEGLKRYRELERNPTPVVWLHWDAPNYFAQSIASVLAASPASPLVVLGDSSNAFLPCQHVPLTRVGASAWEFLESYRHASENDFVYEAFCLMRWFFLKDWAMAAGVQHVVSLDSDILLFADVESELVGRLDGRRYGFAGAMGPHLSILSQEGLAELCDFLLGVYGKGAPDIGGQVSDMTLLPRFLEGRDWADLTQERNGARVDRNLRLGEGLRMSGEVKEIRFRQGRAMAKRETGEEEVRLLALHFQGTAKARMLRSLARQDITY